MGLHGITQNYTDLHGITQIYTELHRFSWHQTDLQGITQNFHGIKAPSRTGFVGGELIGMTPN